jgi:NitT/TauT family transport system substrate-binding protein
MRGPRLYSLPLVLAATLAVAGVTACSSSSSSGTTTSSAGQGPELSNVTLYTTLSPDPVAVWIAQQDGFFKQEGLNVKVVYAQGSAAEESGLLSHTADFAMENYVTAFEEQYKNPQLGMRIIADDEQGAPNTNVIMVAKNSKITSLADLKGKPVAFPSPGLDFGDLALDEQLKGYGLGPNSFVDEAMGFPDMIEPLARGEIAAAFVIQPFITIMETSIGARPLVDLMSGPLSDFPVTGYATTSWFDQHYPRTVAAFQRALEKGQQLAATDQALVRQLIPEHITTMSKSIADVIPLQTYNTSLSLTRLQRVADVMEQFGALPANFDVSSLIIPMPSGS